MRIISCIRRFPWILIKGLVDSAPHLSGEGSVILLLRRRLTDLDIFDSGGHLLKALWGGQHRRPSNLRSAYEWKRPAKQGCLSSTDNEKGGKQKGPEKFRLESRYGIGNGKHMRSTSPKGTDSNIFSAVCRET